MNNELLLSIQDVLSKRLNEIFRASEDPVHTASYLLESALSSDVQRGHSGALDQESPGHNDPVLAFLHEVRQVGKEWLSRLPSMVRPILWDLWAREGYLNNGEHIRGLVAKLEGDSLQNKAVYSDNAGIAEFVGKYGCPGKKSIVIERNSRVFDIAEKCLALEGFQGKIVLGDCLTEDRCNKQFDVVYMEPPFGIKITGDQVAEIFNSDNGLLKIYPDHSPVTMFRKDIVWIDHAVKRMKKTGSAYLLMPANCVDALDPYSVKVRNYLIDKRLVQALVLLPRTRHHAVQSLLIILKSNQEGVVRFVNASAMGEYDRKRKGELTQENLSDLYSLLTEDRKDKRLALVGFGQLLERGWSSYFSNNPMKKEQEIDLSEAVDDFILAQNRLRELLGEEYGGFEIHKVGS